MLNPHHAGGDSVTITASLPWTGQGHHMATRQRVDDIHSAGSRSTDQMRPQTKNKLATTIAKRYVAANQTRTINNEGV